MVNPFWEYSLVAYAAEDVASAVVALQDTFDMDVNMLLYGAWLAASGQGLTQAHLAELDAHIRDCREALIKPLRLLRRELRGDVSVEAQYEDIKALELCAERLQQDQMHRFYQTTIPLPRAEAPLFQNLAMTSRLYHSQDSALAPLLRRLTAALEG